MTRPESGAADERPLAVFDIDGVLADVRHRLHFLQCRPQRWERFFSSAAPLSGRVTPGGWG